MTVGANTDTHMDRTRVFVDVCVYDGDHYVHSAALMGCWQCVCVVCAFGVCGFLILAMILGAR